MQLSDLTDLIEIKRDLVRSIERMKDTPTQERLRSCLSDVESQIATLQAQLEHATLQAQLEHAAQRQNAQTQEDQG